jgi:hypothetical protein
MLFMVGANYLAPLGASSWSAFCVPAALSLVTPAKAGVHVFLQPDGT